MLNKTKTNIMKLNKVFIIAVLSGLAFTSCKNNERGIDDDNRVEMDRMEADRDAELRANQQRMDENNVTARIQRNQNLTTFNEGLTRNQISQDLNRRSTTQTGTTTGQTGTTTGQTGTTTGQTGTTTNQTGTTTNQTETTTGQTGTTTNQGTATGQNNAQGMSTGQREYTIFAPTNDAFSSLSENERNEWNSTQNRDRNVASINYLMVDQRLTADQLRQQIQSANGTHTIRTMQGENLTATLDGNNIVLRDAAGNQARVIESDTEGSNGVIHVIDKVLRPSDYNRNDARTNAANNTGTNTTGTNTGTTTGTTNNRTNNQ